MYNINNNLLRERKILGLKVDRTNKERVEKENHEAKRHNLDTKKELGDLLQQSISVGE